MSITLRALVFERDRNGRAVALLSNDDRKDIYAADQVSKGVHRTMVYQGRGTYDGLDAAGLAVKKQASLHVVVTSELETGDAKTEHDALVQELMRDFVALTDTASGTASDLPNRVDRVRNGLEVVADGDTLIIPATV
jgi:hypothetical protein